MKDGFDVLKLHRKDVALAHMLIRTEDDDASEEPSETDLAFAAALDDTFMYQLADTIHHELVNAGNTYWDALVMLLQVYLESFDEVSA